MTNCILITGGAGFIGSNYHRYASQGSRFRIVAPHHNELDILDREKLKKFISKFHPEVMINFAAFRNANLAERERGDMAGSAWRTNVVGVENTSRICQEYEIFLIHISTDMVFSGRETTRGPYSETAKPEKEMNYLSWYGWTKAEAERMVSKNTNAAIVRIGNITQPVYDPKLDYVGKILYLFDRGQLYPLFDDQYLTLTSIPLLCRVIEALAVQKTPGIYHVASKDIFTPHELGTYLVKKMYGKAGIIARTSIASYLGKMPHRYPQYGGLLSLETQRLLGIAMPRWKEIIDAALPLFHQRIEDAARSRDKFT